MQLHAVSGSLLHDEVLTQRITAHLRSRSERSIRELRIEVEGQGLVLWGRTHTYYGKQMAQIVAMEVFGLPIVANNIEVI